MNSHGPIPAVPVPVPAPMFVPVPVLVSGPVVVGVGRSAAGRGAVTWAADEAARTGRVLRLVHALKWPQTDPDEDTPRLLDDHVRVGGDIVLAQARTFVEERHPGLETETRTVDGPRARGLLEQAADASLLVVGAKRRPVVEQVLTLPPIGVQLSAHAPCPVAVVRETADPAAHAPAPRPLVVVGVDGSPGSLAALELAFAQAAAHGAVLRVVRVCRDRPGRTAAAHTAAAGRCESRLLSATAELRHRDPRVEVEHEVVFGRPVGALLGEAARARCLVVGSRGLGGFRGLLLGSVSHALIEHAECPLIVVPPGKDY
ncbi:universal stress protein [Kitasatospora sp. NPDC086791]|uniref:universal stress protein n=1 Tax=Kitasatospora sp. NPDC086791 TaxID=3155178 RepID=UPI0034188BD7